LSPLTSSKRECGQPCCPPMCRAFGSFAHGSLPLLRSSPKNPTTLVSSRFSPTRLLCSRRDPQTSIPSGAPLPRRPLRPSGFAYEGGRLTPTHRRWADSLLTPSAQRSNPRQPPRFRSSTDPTTRSRTSHRQPTDQSKADACRSDASTLRAGCLRQSLTSCERRPLAERGSDHRGHAQKGGDHHGGIRRRAS
jgi:hypothetical protein